MKKINIYIILAILTAGIFSCKDNEMFSDIHELTADESAEIARQDSIAKAEKERINADLVLEYSLVITTSASQYSGSQLVIEMNKIAELFGISEAEILAGIAGESGAPEIKGFAIEGTTHADNGTASTTNALWGHWWNADGDVTNWGEDAMLFAEFNTEDGEFFVGQYPGHLVDADTIKFIEALKYDEKRLAVVITVITSAPEVHELTVASTQDLSITITSNDDYSQDSLQFDLDKVLSDLGISSMDEVTFIGVNEDGSYAEAYTADAPGFWYDLNGYVGSWGEGIASVYTAYGAFTADKIGIGQFPGALAAGSVLNIKYGIVANYKIVMLNITINVDGYVDPEVAPVGDPTSLEKSIVLTKEYSDDYASVTENLQDVLRDAFKMTTYQIHTAINSGELKLYQGVVSETDPEYTADAPGYWLKDDGTVGAWGESLVWCSIGHTETELYLYGGNHPDNAVAGNSVSTVLIATLNGGQVTLNITFNIGNGGEEPAGATFDVNETYNADYTATVTDVTTVLTDGLGLTAAEIGAAIDDQSLVLEGLNADGTVYLDGEGNPGQTANYPGHWYSLAGDVVGWGGESIFYSELRFVEGALVFNQGHHPGNAAVGQETTIKQVVKLNDKDVTFTFNLKIVE